MTEKQTTFLDKQAYQLEVTRPVWLPYNDIARDIVGSMVKQFDYPTSGPKAERYVVVYPVTAFETERQFCLARVFGSS